MLKLNFWKKEEIKEPEKLEKKVVLDQKSLDIGSSMGELNQKFDKLSMAIGQCFVAIDRKIDNYKDNIVVIQDGITKQVEQHEDFKNFLESYENKVMRLIRNLRFEIEAEINATVDEATKERLGKTLEKINTSLILSLIKEKGPIETAALEEEVIKNKVCSKATLFRKLKDLRERGLVSKEEKDGKIFYFVSQDTENKEESHENPEGSQAWQQS